MAAKVIETLRRKTGLPVRILMSAGIFSIEGPLLEGRMDPVMKAMEREIQQDGNQPAMPG